jgi:hypothetical protein
VVDNLKNLALKKLNMVGMTLRSPSSKLRDIQKAYDELDAIESAVGALGSIKFMGEKPGMKLDKDTVAQTQKAVKDVEAGKVPKFSIGTAPTVPQRVAIQAVPPTPPPLPRPTQPMSPRQVPAEIRGAARVTPNPQPFQRAPGATQPVPRQALQYAQSKGVPTGMFDPTLGQRGPGGLREFIEQTLRDALRERRIRKGRQQE